MEQNISSYELRKRKREIILCIIIVILFIIFTYCETRIITFGGNIPISNTILMFILININMLLLLLLIFLVFRNVVKVFSEKRLKVVGSKLRVKLVLAFIGLSLIPTIVFFYFSIAFITTSIEFWFDVPIEQALNNALSVGRSLYENIENNNSFYVQKMSAQISRRNLIKSKKKLKSYVLTARRAFNLYSIEIYSMNSARLLISMASEMEEEFFPKVSADDLQKNPPPLGIRHIKEPSIEGEYIRSIATIPFDVERKDAKAMIVVTTLIPKDLSNRLVSISRGFEEYSQFKLLKNPVKTTHYITISIVALLIIFTAIWFGLRLSKSITIPIKLLAEGTRKVAEGDLSFEIGQISDDEMGSLVNSFNKMTKDLQQSRDQLELYTNKLKIQNIEIEEKRQYMEIILQNISTGVISIDHENIVTTINESAKQMLSLDPEVILKKNYMKLLEENYLTLAMEILEKLKMSNSTQLTLKLNINGRPRTFMLHATALKKADQNMGIVVVFDDLTEQEKAQRIAAWREVARRIAHEVKNPLTPIKLSAQRLQRKYAKQIDDNVFYECTGTIIDQVDQIRNLVNEFSAFARFPTVKPELCELPPLIDESVALYREGTPHIKFEVIIKNNIPKINIDKQQIKRALINFFDNAIASIDSNGSIIISLFHEIKQNVVVMEIADSGTGISAEDKPRLFEPYFSTKKSGTGLGLSIVNSIISDHNGRISVEDNQPKGTKFIIELPV